MWRKSTSQNKIQFKFKYASFVVLTTTTVSLFLSILAQHYTVSQPRRPVKEDCSENNLLLLLLLLLLL